MAWYHVGNCSCPVGCCDCGPTPEPRIYTEEELNARNRHVWYTYNPEYLYCEDMIVGTEERHKPDYHKSWKFLYLGKL